MSKTKFFTQLSIISTLTAVLIKGLCIFPNLAVFQELAWWSLAFFMLLNTILYFYSVNAASHEDKNRFINIFMVFTGCKLFFSTILILIYVQLYAPTSNFFILPFFAIYLIFTIFEITFLAHISKTQH